MDKVIWECVRINVSACVEGHEMRPDLYSYKERTYRNDVKTVFVYEILKNVKPKI